MDILAPLIGMGILVFFVAVTGRQTYLAWEKPEAYLEKARRSPYLKSWSDVSLVEIGRLLHSFGFVLSLLCLIGLVVGYLGNVLF